MTNNVLIALIFGQPMNPSEVTNWSSFWIPEQPASGGSTLGRGWRPCHRMHLTSPHSSSCRPQLAPVRAHCAGQLFSRHLHPRLGPPWHTKTVPLPFRCWWVPFVCFLPNVFYWMSLFFWHSIVVQLVPLRFGGTSSLDTCWPLLMRGTLRCGTSARAPLPSSTSLHILPRWA